MSSVAFFEMAAPVVEIKKQELVFSGKAHVNVSMHLLPSYRFTIELRWLCTCKNQTSIRSELITDAESQQSIRSRESQRTVEEIHTGCAEENRYFSLVINSISQNLCRTLL
jgi:hypothetical protein